MSSDSSSREPGRSPYLVDTSRGPVRVVIEQPRGSWIGRALKWVVTLLVILFLFGMYNSALETGELLTQERWHSLSKTANDKIAIVSVSGTILGEEGFVKRQLDHVRGDQHVKAIVLRVDSPGGTVTGSESCRLW
jgi:protease IV